MAGPPCQAGSTFIGAAQTQPCFLHSIIGFVERTEHVIRYARRWPLFSSNFSANHSYSAMLSHSSLASAKHADE